MTGLAVAELPVVTAQVNWGRWILPCPRCPGAALAASRRHSPIPDLQLLPDDRDPPVQEPPLFRCNNCGQKAVIEWPPIPMIRGVERLLMMRPDPNTRSWYPHETLVELVAQNVIYGIINEENTDVPAGQAALIVAEDHVVKDEMPTLEGRESQKAVES